MKPIALLLLLVTLPAHADPPRPKSTPLQRAALILPTPAATQATDAIPVSCPPCLQLPQVTTGDAERTAYLRTILGSIGGLGVALSALGGWLVVDRAGVVGVR